MSLTLPLTYLLMNNHVMVPITTLTFSSPIPKTAISSTSGMVIINPAPAISIAATRQDAYSETKLNAMKKAIFKLGSTWKNSF